jgi:hypothetical protein
VRTIDTTAHITLCRRLIWLWAALTVLWAPAAGFAAVSVQASVDRSELAEGEPLTLRVMVRGGSGEVDTGGITDFEVISRGTSTSIQMSGGQFTRETIYTFTLMPRKAGRLTIPAMPVASGGRTYHTHEITVSVGPAVRRQGGASPELFVEADVSRRNPYEGEQIRYTFRVWRRTRITDATFQRPDFPGFEVQELEARKEYKAVSGGLEYRVTEVGFILTPLGAGEKRIGPGVLNCSILRAAGRRRSVFEDPFFRLRAGRTEPRVLRSDPVAVSVQPLPPYHGDAIFSGLVGDFDIAAELAATDLQVGDSTTFAVTVTGRGNIMDAGAPDIPAGDAFKIYSDAPEEEVRLTEAGYVGKKVFRAALVPLEAGTYDLPSIRWVYFDVSKAAYAPLETPAFRVRVQPSDRPEDLAAAAAEAPERGSAKTSVDFVGRDILPLKDGIDAFRNQRPMSGLLLLAALLAPAALWLGFRAYLGLRKRDPDPQSRMAGKAERALREAAAMTPSGDKFFGCLYRGLVSAALSRSGAVGESLTYAELSKILLSHGFSSEDADAAAGLLARIESARYGGGAIDPMDGKQLLAETRRMVRRLVR